ncbi:MAG TPA: redoxin domain-containing protein [Puia sp.]|nr:redoxin domain-containing protein [Puia sp.]
MRLLLLLMLFGQPGVWAQGGDLPPAEALQPGGMAPPVGMPQPGGMPPPAEVLPSIRFERIGGGVLTNADLPKGKLLLFVFVDPDCDHCQRAVARMDAEYESFGKAALYFVSAADPAKIVAFAKKYGPRLKGVWARDRDSQNIVRFRPVRYPALFLYSMDKKLLDYEDNEETIFRVVRSIGRNG